MGGVSLPSEGLIWTLSSVLGVLLAVTFIAGTFIAIDSSARAALDAYPSGIPGELTIRVPLGDVEQASQDLEAVPGITSTIAYVQLNGFSLGRWNSSSFTFASGLAVDPEDPPSTFLSSTLIEGTLNLTQGGIVIRETVAQRLGASVGETIFLTIGWFGEEGVPRKCTSTGAGSSVPTTSKRPGEIWPGWRGRSRPS